LIALFAILFGLAGAYFVKRALSQKPAPVPVVKEVRVNVPLAAFDMPVGRTVSDGDFYVVSFSQAQLQKQAYPPNVLGDGRQLIGRTLRQPINAGRPFVTGCFFPDGTGPDLTERLKPGFRAVTISIHGAAAIAAQATPGGKVDVIFRASADDKRYIPELTTVLVRNAEILALGSNSCVGLRGGLSTKDDASPVTLAVTAVQANELKTVEGHGELSLVLRQEDDSAPAHDGEPITLRELLNLPPPPPKYEPFVAEIYRGGTRQTLRFEKARVAKEDFGGINFRPPLLPPGSPANDPDEPTNKAPAAPAADPSDDGPAL
jgi:Flp pilus assembly protein CpaB